MTPNPKDRGIRLLEFDGGGINVLSALIILFEIMRRLQATLQLAELPLPCDIFDLICGTGTGGLVAILLGRLRLPITTAIDCYVEILERGFVKKGLGIRFGTDDAFSATALEKVVGEIVARHGGKSDARMIDREASQDSCKVMVCAMSADAIRGNLPTLIRTYRVATNQGPECTIVEAVRATMATPGMFKKAAIMEQSVRTKYVSGGLGCNNPTTYMLDETEKLFSERSIATVLSVGSGQLHSASVPDRSKLSQFLPLQLIQTLESVATDCEKTNQDLSRRFSHTPDVYFRFNAEQGMQDIDQSDLAQLSKVRAHTLNYLKDAVVSSKADSAAQSIAAGVGAVKILEGNIQPMKQSSTRIGRCPPPSRAFTGRVDILDKMQGYFFDASPMERHLLVLCGLGGAGKTQLALRFVQMHKDRFWDVFYVDATTRETASAGLISLAKAAKAGETQEEALAWLVSCEERWLLVLNNADDPKLNLREFFPRCTHGDILVTTRNQEMRTHTQGRGLFCRVGGMLPKDALELMLKVSPAEADEDSVSIATSLVEEFGYFALAIVQASACMSTTECGLAEYQKIFQTARAQVLQQSLTQQQDDHELSPFVSWQISYEQLSARSAQLLHIMSFFHHEGIAEAFFEAASVEAVSFEPEIPLTETQVATQTVIFDFLSSLRTSNEWNPLALRDLTRQLRAFSLLDYDTQTRSYSMHPLVREWSRNTAPDATTVRVCAAWVLALCVNFQQTSEDYSIRRRLLPHLLALDSGHTPMIPELANRLQLVYFEAGYEKKNEALTAMALQASRDALGNEHSTTLDCIHNLSLAFQSQGRLEEAEALQTEEIELSKRLHSHDHPETLSSMHSLALTYHDQERWQEATGLLLEVIESKKRVIGAEHRDTLVSMSALASTYWSQGRLEDAEAIEVEVLETMVRVLGNEHPDTLQAMHNLAATYDEQGKLQEAESLLEMTVDLKKKVLGESHVDTQKSAQYLEGVQRRIRSELLSDSVL